MSSIGPHGDLGRVERREPVGRGPGSEDLGQDRAQGRPVLDSIAVGREARVLGEGRKSQRGAQPGPLALGPDSDRDRAVGGVPNVSYGTMFGCALPSRPGALPEDERVLRLVDEARQRRAEQRDVDPLARSEAGPSSRSRPTSAARTPTAPSIPDTTSLIATPTLVGSPPSASAAPVIDISPLTAWTMKS